MNETKWPAERPLSKPMMHGWFTKQNAEMLNRYVGHGTRCIIEIGSWYGMSTRWLCQRASHADIFCIDPWEPYPEILTNPEWAALQPGAYENFLNNLWEYRHRVHILKIRSAEGLYECRRLNPDVVYIDGDHSRAHVMCEVEIARRQWPDATLVGDDWQRESVRFGVMDAAGFRSFQRDFKQNEQCWALEPLQPDAGAV
jgi:hypothetical protein